MSDNPLNLPEQLAITPTQLNSLYNKGYDWEVCGKWRLLLYSAPNPSETEQNLQEKVNMLYETLELDKASTRFVIDNSSFISGNTKMVTTVTPVKITSPENC